MSQKTLFSSALLVVAIVVVASFSEAKTSNYNETEATRSWYFCKLNACVPEQISNGFSCPVCKDIERIYGETLTDVSVFYHMKDLAHGYVGYSPQRNQIIVGFRGTRSVQWFFDFDFKRVPLEGCPSSVSECLVHEGFQDIWNVLQPNVTLHVSNLLSKYKMNKPVVQVQGHSLGATTALLATYSLITRINAPVTKLINFGCPRVLNYQASVYVGNFLEKAGVSYWRLVWAKDIVPKVPTLSMGFWHLPQEIWYPKNSTANGYVVCNDAIGSEDLSQNCSFGAVTVQESDPADHGWYMGIEHGCSN